MKTIKFVIAATMLAAALPATAGKPENDRKDRQERQDRGDRQDRQSASRGEVERSRDRLRAERQDVREAQRSGSRRDVRMEQRDVDRARQEYQRDARDWRISDKRRFQESRKNAPGWNRGLRYGWDRPDPRYNGYYADNYYRSGNYRVRQIGSNDRIYRGNDNRYYCRRNDGTTGLIIGAIGGGVLGNVIAPGGSKTLGSILGGSLGAILGNAIGSNGVTCR
ncbi:hypothetical protein [Sandarakinorhabdus sp.]|uniref:hypothetical protein n=1 Tax=Sandarakinorhabdus sp. TaxID=1916663 RepID=UPI00286D8777|nr:hypothetical protein [Sandarakinorhabdus sp.]